MFGLGALELGIIAFILILLFGLGKLPKVAGQLGEGVRSFRDSVTGKDGEIEIGPDAEVEPAKLEDQQGEQVVQDASLAAQQEQSDHAPDGKSW